MNFIVSDGDFEKFVSDNAPVVFTKENTNICHGKHQNECGNNCRFKRIPCQTFKQMYENNGFASPDLVWGPGCSTFEECNDRAFPVRDQGKTVN